MKRIIIAGTVLVALVCAAAAWAATDPNSYSGSTTVTPNKAGSAKKPVPVGWSQTINVKSSESGYDAAPLKDIKTTIYGLKVDTSLASTCSSSKIESSGGTGCPSKSLVATGTVTSRLGRSDRNPTYSENCGPLTLNVYNGGKNYVWFFFIVPSVTACPGAHTGSAAPYKATFSRSGKNMVLNVPLPADVSTNAANLGLYASLTHEQLTWKTISGKSKGKKVGYFETVGCKAGKRPYKVTYTDTTNGTNRFSTTQSGKDKC